MQRVGFCSRVNLASVGVVFLGALLLACGGSGGSKSRPSTSSSSSSSSVVSVGDVTLSGRVTYDHVPHKTTLIGLNYNAIVARPGRGLVVELLGQNNQLLASTSTDVNGNYRFTAPDNTQVRVRVKAQLISNQAPTWDIRVRDNTSNDALYVMDGSLATTGTTDSIRDLHAASGWTGNSYGNPRVAAPFAILDGLYTALNRFVEAGYQQPLPALNIFWSIKNKTAEGDPRLGEIGTSYYSDSAIYILGEANSDTDEYDTHVILHEWGHYLENALFRTDTLGGDHSQDVPLDMRLALSEGVATALASMMLNNPLYADSLGVRQSSGFYFDASDKNPSLKGWYAEGSISSIIYNYYLSAINKTSRNFADVLTGISSADYVDTETAVTIYTFAHAIKSQHPTHGATVDALMVEQNIFGTDIFGNNETNNGGATDVLPLYKNLVIDGAPTQVCSSNSQGSYNKLGVHQYLYLAISSGGAFQFRVNKQSAHSIATNPDIEIYRAGVLVANGDSSLTDSETLSTSLTAGNYWIAVFDATNYDENLVATRRACFDVRVQTN